MDRSIGPFRQRIMGGIESNGQIDPRQGLDIGSVQDDWIGGLGLQPLAQGQASYNTFGSASNIDAYSQFGPPSSTPFPTWTSSASQFQPSYTTTAFSPNNPSPQWQQPSFTNAPGPTRLSLAPRNTYNEMAEPSRILNNASNYFRQDHTSYQGMPANQSIPRSMIPQTTRGSPTNFMAQNRCSGPVSMIPQYTEYGQLPEPSNVNNFVRENSTQPSLFYPQAEQLNWNGILYGPDPSAQQVLQPQRGQGPFQAPGSRLSQGPESSSPMPLSASSPTTRVSLRRTSHTTTSTNEGHGRSAYSTPQLTKMTNVPQTPQRHNSQQPQPTPRTLNLPHAPPMVQGIPIITPQEKFGDQFRHIFPYNSFTPSSRTPTGSGKTVLLELAICKLVGNYPAGHFKIVYQAPTKSLCSERLRDWDKKFRHFNLAVAELTGDTSQAEMTRVRNATIIVTTPEKWDSITRKWADHAKLVQMVKLFLIDEVHMLKDNRGATLEAVVSRMKTMGTRVRFMAISATVPNALDIARWLGKDHANQHMPAHLEEFGDNFRPVRLVKWVRGFDGAMNDFQFDSTLDNKLPAVVQQYSEKKPIMVFCFTRKSCEKTAHILAEHWTRQKAADRPWPGPTKKVVVGNKELQDLVDCGVAFHHAGLDPHDRHAIETAFLKSDICVICCTSTLAVGVNLPCHLVILKGTVGYQDGGKLTEYSDLDVIQMLGRAGRPQFDTSAVAVIMTRSEKVNRYNKLISGQEMLESTLHRCLIEHLNSEISLGTIKGLSEAKRWIYGTFLAVRMKQKPAYYKTDDIADGLDLNRTLELACEKAIKLLQDHGFVSMGYSFGATEYGHAMSRYMIPFETSKGILALPRQAKMNQILQQISQAGEFQDLRMKPAERPFLREFNNSPLLKYSLKENINSTWQKIYLMIQVQLGGFELPSESEFNKVRRQFSMETNIILERAQRLVRFVIDCKASDNDAISVSNGLDLLRSLTAMFWENSNLQLRQIPQLGPVGHRKLVAADINTVEKLFSLDTGSIERIMSRKPSYGHSLKTILLNFPRLALTAQIIGQANIKKGKQPVVHILALLSYENKKVPVWQGKKPSITFMAEISGTIAHTWRGSITKLENKLELKFAVELRGPADIVQCKVACDEIVGTIKTASINLHIPASAFPPQAPQLEKARTASPNATVNTPDEFGDDSLADDDMVIATRHVEADSNLGGTPKNIGSNFNEFADIDDFEREPALQAANVNTKKKDNSSKEDADSELTETVKSTRMPNGRWTCHHTCRDRTQKGQSCRHRCCIEGLDKPRTIKRKVPQVGSALGSRSTSQPKSRKPSGGTSRGRLKSSPANPIEISDTSDVELVDLSQIVPQSTTKKYRKSQQLHDEGQANNHGQVPNIVSQSSYLASEKAQLPFLRDNQHLLPSSETFESPSSNRSLEPIAASHDNTSNVQDSLFGSVSPAPKDTAAALQNDFEVGMMESGISSFSEDPQPGMTLDAGSIDPFEVAAGQNLFDQNFDDQNFNHQDFTDQNFDNFDFNDLNQYGDLFDQTLSQYQFSAEQSKTVAATSSFVPTPSKRPLSPNGMESTSKHPRLAGPEPVTSSSQRPEWTREIDEDLFEQFKDAVEFEDDTGGN